MTNCAIRHVTLAPVENKALIKCGEQRWYTGESVFRSRFATKLDKTSAIGIVIKHKPAWKDSSWTTLTGDDQTITIVFDMDSVEHRRVNDADRRFIRATFGKEIADALNLARIVSCAAPPTPETRATT